MILKKKSRRITTVDLLHSYVLNSVTLTRNLRTPWRWFE